MSRSVFLRARFDAVVLVGALLSCATVPSHLHAQSVTGVSGRVTEAESSRPVQGATVFITGTQRGTQTRADGSYRILAPAGTVSLTVRLIGYTTVSKSATIAEGRIVTADFALARAPMSLASVAVTGSRRTTERTVTEAPVPIDVVSSEEMRVTGRTEITQVL